MIYVHSLVNQLRGDKSRKKNAREEVLQAQNSEIFCSGNFTPENQSRELRLLAYKNLLIAEKSTRLRGIFSPSITSLDFDMDGVKEFLCQLDNMNMYVHLLAGRIFEMDLFGVYRNYCDTPPGRSGLFLDHFITETELGELQNGSFSRDNSVFAKTLYQDVHVDSGRHEILLKTEGLYGALQQTISLRKQFSFKIQEVQVQYILKNDGPFNLSGIFVIELNIALSGSGRTPPRTVVFSRDKTSEDIIKTVSFQDVEWIQISDSDTGVTFTINANENPDATLIPITNMLNSDIEGVRVFLSWKVDLGPGFETEKMVFLKIDS
ncbi:DUF1926 domain-containing protein [Brucepastera parasyntrophica]|uniref:alpha-amylase/4-alpha-glucanotransferase domain-containing protein n=1 Tax=Brucepastera parasyntrophica TaxID=2880008 RepID=UPI00210A5961|nr:alpha-amylase/4-alpha-glucanotransferase domain-containing protein [Brucepastera parasyntrophica]ULQ60019.1 DUF1926 domain-containing protein [Brucepastera parasyntrophica]